MTDEERLIAEGRFYTVVVLCLAVVAIVFIVAVMLNTNSIVSCARSCPRMESYTEKSDPSRATLIPVCTCEKGNE